MFLKLAEFNQGDELKRLLGAKDLEGAAKEGERYVASASNPVLQKRRAAWLFGSEALAALGLEGPGGLDAARKAADEESERVTKHQIDVGKEHEESSHRLGQASGTFWNNLSEKVLPWWSRVEDHISRSLEHTGGKQFIDFIPDLLHGNYSAHAHFDAGAGWDHAQRAASEAKADAGAWWDHASRAASEAKANIAAWLARMPSAAPLSPVNQTIADQRALGLLPGTSEYGREHDRAVALSSLPSERILTQAVRQGVREGVRDSRQDGADLPVAGAAEDALEATPNRPDGFFAPGGASRRTSALAGRVHEARMRERMLAGDGGPMGSAGSSGEVQDFVRAAAIARGVDPNYALRVVDAEGGFDPDWRRGGDDNSSFGPFQLHYGGISELYPHAGEGDGFTAATGLSAKTSATWRQQVEYALNRIVEGGWGPWKGSSGRSSIHGRMGISPDAHEVPIGSMATSPAKKTRMIDRMIREGGFLGPGMFEQGAHGEVNVHLHGLPPKQKMEIGGAEIFRSVEMNRGKWGLGPSWDS